MKKKTTETGIVLSQDTAEIAYHIEVKKSFWNKVRYGGTAVVFTAVFLAVVLALNIFVALADQRFPLSADLTDKALFTVSDKTMEYLTGLTEDAELIVLGNEEEWRNYSASATPGSDTSAGLGVSVHKYIVETLDRYAEGSSHVTVHYADPLYNPGFFEARNRLPADDDLGDPPVIIVYSPTTQRYRYLRASLFRDKNLQYLALENRLNTGIRYATNPNMQKIAILTGHGESALTYFTEVMRDDGYLAEPFDLPTNDAIPSDYAMIVICDPARQYSETDVQKIDDFLRNGGKLGKNLMVFADRRYCNTDTCLKNYLEEWGIALTDQCVFDPSSTRTIGANCPTFAAEYDPQAAQMTGTLAGGDYKLKFELGQTRALKKLFDAQDGFEVFTLLSSSGNSFSRFLAGNTPAAKLTSMKKEEGDQAGPFDLGIVSLLTRTDNLDSYKSTVTVFGSTSLADDYFISNVDSENQATQEYMAQLTNFLVGQNEELFEHIQTVSLLTDTLHFETDVQVIAVFAVTVAGVPLILFIIGFALWKRRKYL